MSISLPFYQVLRKCSKKIINVLFILCLCLYSIQLLTGLDIIFKEKPCQSCKHLIKYISIISGVKEVRAWLMYVLFAEKGLLLESKSATPISGQRGLGNLTCKGFTPSSTALRPGSVFAPDAYVPVKFNVRSKI